MNTCESIFRFVHSGTAECRYIVGCRYRCYGLDNFRRLCGLWSYPGDQILWDSLAYGYALV